MRFILGLIRIYYWLIIVWAVMTWIPGVSGTAIHQYIGMPIVPVLNLFSFASVSVGGLGIGLQAIIVILILYGIEHLIEKHLLPMEERFDDPRREDDGYGEPDDDLEDEDNRFSR